MENIFNKTNHIILSDGDYTQSSRTTTTTTTRQYSYRTVNGERVEDGDLPITNGNQREVVQKYTHTSQNGYGDGGYGNSRTDYPPGDGYRDAPKGPGSTSSRDSSGRYVLFYFILHGVRRRFKRG